MGSPLSMALPWASDKEAGQLELPRVTQWHPQVQDWWCQGLGD